MHLLRQERVIAISHPTTFSSTFSSSLMKTAHTPKIERRIFRFRRWDGVFSSQPFSLPAVHKFTYFGKQVRSRMKRHGRYEQEKIVEAVRW